MPSVPIASRTAISSAMSGLQTLAKLERDDFSSNRHPALSFFRRIHFMSQTALPKKKVEVLSRQMAYHERGKDQPILFLHGNPTSSFLCRKVILALEVRDRLI